MFEDFIGILIYMISINEDCLCSNDLIYCICDMRGVIKYAKKTQLNNKIKPTNIYFCISLLLHTFMPNFGRNKPCVIKYPEILFV